jgi:hypothetical protein
VTTDLVADKGLGGWCGGHVSEEARRRARYEIYAEGPEVGVYRVYMLGRVCISTRGVVNLIMMPGDEKHISPKVPRSLPYACCSLVVV